MLDKVVGSKASNIPPKNTVGGSLDTDYSESREEKGLPNVRVSRKRKHREMQTPYLFNSIYGKN